MGATRMKKTHSPKNRIHNIAKPSSSGSNINKGLTASKPLRYQGSNVTRLLKMLVEPPQELKYLNTKCIAMIY